MMKYTANINLRIGRPRESVTWVALGGRQFPLYDEANAYFDILMSKGAASVEETAREFESREGVRHTFDEIAANVKDVFEDMAAEGVLVLVN